MRVSSLTLKDIGPFEDAVLEIPPPEEGQRGELVLFEGPNGSGKTTIVQAIAVAVGSRQLFGAPKDVLESPWTDVARKVHGEGGHASVEMVAKASSARVSIDPGGATSADIRYYGPKRPNAVVESLIEFHDAALSERDTRWAAFAFRGHMSTIVMTTPGPRAIAKHPLAGALSFGSSSATDVVGQFLTNIEFERIQAKLVALEASGEEAKAAGRRRADSRKETLERFRTALGHVLDRHIDLEFPLGSMSPRMRFDGEEIPIDLLGEGMRNTVSWLSDLLVRLERIPWKTSDVSPLDQDFWLILDEIEESLHPTAQMRILPALRHLFPNAHMYVTTHSPFVVASVGEGWVFSIRTGERRRVSGTIAPRKLVPGQSLEWVVEEVFGAETGIIDAETRDALKQHRADVARLRKKEPFGDDQWQAFLERRRKLMSLTEEVRSIVAMQEVPVQERIDEHLAQAAE